MSVEGTPTFTLGSIQVHRMLGMLSEQSVRPWVLSLYPQQQACHVAQLCDGNQPCLSVQTQHINSKASRTDIKVNPVAEFSSRSRRRSGHILLKCVQGLKELPWPTDISWGPFPRIRTLGSKSLPWRPRCVDASAEASGTSRATLRLLRRLASPPA